MSSSKLHRSHAFTVVELLVVMTLIVLLVSIMLPSAKRARAVTRLAVCQSQHHQISYATLAYTADFYGTFMPHTPDPNASYGGGVWSIRVGKKSKVKYRGAGLLIAGDYLTDPRVLYCPVWKFPGYGYGETTTLVKNQGGWPRPGQGWGPTSHVKCSFHYRASFGRGIDGSKGRRLRTTDSSTRAVFADHWTDHINDWPESVGYGEGIWGHRYLSGYNVTYVDGHVQYKPDHEEYIIQSNISKLDHNLVESIWLSWFDMS